MKKRTMEEIRKNVESLVLSYNSFVTEGKVEEALALIPDMEEDVNDYTALAYKKTFDEVAAAENPMHAACLKLQYDSINIKDVKEKESSTIKKEVVDVKKNIDLLRLHKEINGGIGANKDWAYMLQKLNMMLTADAIAKVASTPQEAKEKLEKFDGSYAIADAAKNIDLGKNPVSQTNFKNTLKSIVQAMLGDEYHPKASDLEYLKLVYSKGGKTVRSVSMLQHRNFCWHIANICNNVLTTLGYTVEYKVKK